MKPCFNPHHDVDGAHSTAQLLLDTSCPVHAVFPCLRRKDTVAHEALVAVQQLINLFAIAYEAPPAENKFRARPIIIVGDFHYPGNPTFNCVTSQLFPIYFAYIFFNIVMWFILI